MEHLTEIRANAYVVNLSTFEESELAKRKKKRAQAPKAKDKPKSVAKPETVPEIAAQETPQAPAATEAAQEPAAVREPEAVQQPAGVQEPEGSPQAAAITASEAVPQEGAPDIEGTTVTIGQVQVSYDEGTRLYALQLNGEFYDDSPDLDRITRLVKQLVPDAAEHQLSSLKKL
ncbi:hypothetical protein [Desulfoferrobacter suflitae]|uniref:hypothetical protein n=1 Tax=Desulfoferrobacter suflitae TaxID=2865782 RepID=UPI0021644C15|nr:hypothetical protein [Desulfoferrobacter suflitae]MCK8603154.1 hypothetical protein [Desulfoferrobacter suflitae]